MAIQGDVTITVDEAALKSAGNTLKDRIQSMRTSYDNVMTIVQNTGKYWIGVAGDEHRSAFAEQRDDIDTILKRLQEHSDDLFKIAGIYVQAEEEVKEAPSGLRITLID